MEQEEILSEYTSVFSEAALRGRTALVTGGATGIGFRIAEVFLVRSISDTSNIDVIQRHGCSVVIASRKIDKLKQVPYQLLRTTATSVLMSRAPGNRSFWEIRDLPLGATGRAEPSLCQGLCGQNHTSPWVT